MKKTIKVLFSSLVFTVLLTILSFVINILILGEAHEKYAFFRPDDDLRIKPGLFITSFVWSILISLGYIYFGSIIKIKNRFLKGAKYGLIVYVFFVFCQEFYYYQFIKFDFVIIAGSLIHYLMTFVIGGGLIGLILSNTPDKQD